MTKCPCGADGAWICGGCATQSWADIAQQYVELAGAPDYPTPAPAGLDDLGHDLFHLASDVPAPFGGILTELGKAIRASAQEDQVGLARALTTMVWEAIVAGVAIDLPLDELWLEVATSRLSTVALGPVEMPAPPPRIAEVLAGEAR